jgi:hypothetical protein
MEPPVSLSLLPHTVRGEADVVTHCQTRLSEFGGCFFPCISNIRDGTGNGVALFRGLWLFFAAH